jgi:hypothetical protein
MELHDPAAHKPEVICGRSLTAQLAARVPLPTADEREVWEAYKSGVSYPSDWKNPRKEAVAAWAAGRARLERYRQRRHRGESFADWNAREPAFTWTSVPFGGAPGAAAGAPACFAALGLVLPCSTADVQAAWKRLAAGAHPDRGGSHAAFIALGQARDDALAWLARAA